MTTKQMKAIRLTQKCPIEDMKPVSVPRPEVKSGYALVKVKAFGVNESEVTSRKGESDRDFSFPRILGIEGVGVVEEVAEDSRFSLGQQVATMMNGLGRQVDGSYAEYMLVKEDYLIPFESDLDWSILGAVPEMLQTANGSITRGLDLQKGESLLIRGGTSTVGLMAALLAKQKGARVLSTSRKEEKLADLEAYGVDVPLLDDATLSDNIHKHAPGGVDKVLELVGLSTLFEDMSYLKEGGKACFTGALGGQWTMDQFSPFMIPFGKYLTSYAGGALDLPSETLNSFLAAVKTEGLTVPIAKVYHGLEEVGQAHANLESHAFTGKHVVVL